MGDSFPIWLLKVGYLTTVATTILGGLLIYAGYYHAKDETKSLIGTVLKKKNRTAFRF